MLALPHAFISGTRVSSSRSFTRAWPDLAGRRSALETVEKVVTGILATGIDLGGLRWWSRRLGSADPEWHDMESVEVDGELDAGVRLLHVGVGPHDPVPPAADVRRKGAAEFDGDWLYPGPSTCLALGLGDGRRFCLGDLRSSHGLIITAVTVVRARPRDSNKTIRVCLLVLGLTNVCVWRR
jgi:hypothetical protein